MWTLLLLTSVMFWMVASVTKQLATSKFGRVGARLFYALMWACFIAAGIDIARTHNLYAPLLVVCSVLLFRVGEALQSDTLRQRYTNMVWYSATAIGVSIALFVAAFLNFMAWVMRSGILFILFAAFATAGCGGNNDINFWVMLLIIGAGCGFIIWSRCYSEIPAKPLTSEEVDEDDEFICSCCNEEVDELTMCDMDCGNIYCDECAPHMLNDAGLCGDCQEGGAA